MSEVCINAPSCNHRCACDIDICGDFVPTTSYLKDVIEPAKARQKEIKR